MGFVMLGEKNFAVVIKLFFYKLFHEEFLLDPQRDCLNKRLNAKGRIG